MMGKLAARAGAESFCLEPQAESRETELKTTPALRLSELASSGAPLPVSPHLPNLPKQCHQQGTNSNVRDYGRYLI